MHTEIFGIRFDHSRNLSRKDKESLKIEAAFANKHRQIEFLKEEKIKTRREIIIKAVNSSGLKNEIDIEKYLDLSSFDKSRLTALAALLSSNDFEAVLKNRDAAKIYAEHLEKIYEAVNNRRIE